MSETTLPEKHNYKLDTPTKMKVLAMIARGEKYETISRILKDQHNIDYTTSGLADLKKSNADTIKEMELMILDAETSEAEQIRVKSLRQLSKKLDRASEDETELQEIDRQYRAGEIEFAEYKRLKTGLLKLTVKDLTAISKDMYAQSGGKRGANALPGAASTGNTDTPDPKWVEALMTAVQRGDTIAMQQLVITPNA